MKQLKLKFALRTWLFAVGVLALIGFMFFGSSPDMLMAGAQVVGCGALFLAGVNITDKSLAELKELRGQAQQKLEDLVEKAKTEKRSLSEDEVKERDDLATSLRSIVNEIGIKEVIEEERRQMAHKKLKKESENKEQRELAQYSIVKAIREAVRSKTGGEGLTGIEKEMHEEALKEARANNTSINGIGIPSMIIEQRDLTATGQTTVAGDQGGLTIQSTKQGFIDTLKARLVFAGLGSNFLTGLSGNLSIPKLTADTNPDWAATENVAAGASQPLFGSVELSPKRLTTKIAISNQLLQQSSIGVDQIVIANLMAKMKLKLEAAAINGTGATGIPRGILNTVGIGSVAGGANGLIPTFKNLVDLESLVANQNADLGKMAYLTNSKVRGILKSTPKIAGYPSYMWEVGDAPLNGYNAAVTNLVPSNLTKGTANAICSAILFGNWEELTFAQWGAFDLVIDNLSLAENNEIKLVLHSFWDIAVSHPESFSAMVDALTA